MRIFEKELLSRSVLSSALTLSLAFTAFIWIETASARFYDLDDPSHTLLGQLSQADHVIVGDIVHYTRMRSKGGIWTEDLVIFHVVGHALTAEGKKRIPGRFLLRGGVIDDRSAQATVDRNTDDQLLIIENGHQIDTVSPVYFENGMVLSVTTNKPVLKIVDGNPGHAITWNNPDCAPNADGSYTDQTLVDDEGAEHTITVEQQIDMVTVQSCPDGSVWAKGRDMPADYQDPEPISVTEFEQQIVKYMAEDLSEASVPRSGLAPNLKPHNPHLIVAEELRHLDVAMADAFERIDNLAEKNPEMTAFMVERMDYYGAPYSNRLSSIRDRYFSENPRPSHAQKRPRPQR